MLWKALAALVALGAALFIVALKAHRQFDRLEPDLIGNCTPVRGIAGPEDLQVDPVGRRLFVSSFDKRATNVRRGSIHVLNVDDPLDAAGWRDRTNGRPEEFLPIGLHYYAKDEIQRLFVVNAASNAVELYDIESDGDLIHLETFTERRLKSPNDVVAIGPNDFLVTNDASAGRSSMLGRVQFLARARVGSVLRFNGTAWSLVDDHLRFANGIAINESGDRLYVGESAGRAVRIYQRPPGEEIFKLQDVIDMPGAVENLNVASDGRVIAAANPKPLSMALHRRSPEALSPSLIVQLGSSIAGEGPAPIKPLFRSDGVFLSAATAADVIGSKLFVGTLADDRFLICNGA
ncbi:MAG: hypothetical protein GC152_13800 [Alphaproteobacteria bacterium]|nr:hypothetical protein [Alphaproteobacteria bacterium]